MEGRFEAALANGRLNSNMLALTGLDLTSWVMSASKRDGFTGLSCFIARFTVKRQVATAQALLLDTPHVQLSGKGTSQADANVEVTPQPKKHRLVEVVTSFTISGPLSDLEATIRPGGAVARGTAEVLLLPTNVPGNLVGLFGKRDKEGGNPCPRR